MNTTLMIGAVLAHMLVRPWSQTNEPTDVRVARDFTDRPDAAVVHYAVPPMSGVQRLPDAYPHDGVAGGTVGIVMAKDEYEPGSFLLYARRDFDKVQLDLGEFRSEKGDVFPAADRVNTSMTDDDVREIAENYLSRIRDIRFEVSRLRARWLAERALR